MLTLAKFQLPWNGGVRKGLILQKDGRFSEISPLPGFSKETLEEAEEDVWKWMKFGKESHLPSVRWGIECLEHDLNSIHIPLCALGAKENFSHVKLKLGHLPINEAIELVKQNLKKHTLRLDCNKAWTLSDALTFASHFKPDDFEYLEEPVQTFEELIQFSKLTKFPIAVDESIHSDWNKIETLKALIIKPTLVGTIPDHPKVILSSSHESGLGLLHIANRAKTSKPIGLDTYCYLQEDLLLNPIECKNGRFSWEKSHPLLKTELLCVL